MGRGHGVMGSLRTEGCASIVWVRRRQSKQVGTQEDEARTRDRHPGRGVFLIYSRRTGGKVFLELGLSVGQRPQPRQIR